MTHLHRQARIARRRLWINHWLTTLGWCLTGALVVLAVALAVSRGAELLLPMNIVLGTLGGAVLIVSLVWASMRCEEEQEAAAVLDKAAGLKERVSSGLYCESMNDPYAQAVVADAEKLSSAVTARQFIPVRAPRSGGWAVGSAAVAALTLLLPMGWLSGEDDAPQGLDNQQVQQTNVVVKRQIDTVTKTIRDSETLKDLEQQLQEMEKPSAPEMQRPDQIRNEALKKLDRFADMLRERKEKNLLESNEMRKKLRRLKSDDSDNSLVNKLTKAMANGDFKEAKEHVEQLQEKLAKLNKEDDSEYIRQLEKQLKDLAKQLEEAAKSDKLAQKLQQAGIDKEQAERMLERLSKKDKEEIKKALEQAGMSQQQMKKMMEEMKKSQQASSQCKKMSQSAQQAASAAGQGQMGQSMQNMQAMQDALSDMESLEQELSEIESAMSDVQNSKDNLSNPCGQCNGSGQDKQGGNCSGCNGDGDGNGRDGQGQGGSGGLGQGRGGRPPRGEAGQIAFKKERAKVETREGRIIGQFLIDGEQIPGESRKDFATVIEAAERDASDAVQRDRVSRKYQKAVKEYFSSISQFSNGGTSVEPGEAEGTDD